MAIFTRGQEIEATGVQFFAGELFGDVADGNHAPATEDDSSKRCGFVRETEDAAGRDEFRDLGSRQSEAAFAKTQQNERLERGFGSRSH